MKWLWPVMLLGVLGCSYQKGGTRHTLIIGFGMVSVSSTNQNLAVVTKTSGLGAQIGPASAGLGCFSSTYVEIKTNANVLIEIQDAPGKPLRVTLP